MNEEDYADWQRAEQDRDRARMESEIEDLLALVEQGMCSSQTADDLRAMFRMLGANV